MSGLGCEKINSGNIGMFLNSSSIYMFLAINASASIPDSEVSPLKFFAICVTIEFMVLIDCLDLQEMENFVNFLTKLGFMNYATTVYSSVSTDNCCISCLCWSTHTIGTILES